MGTRTAIALALMLAACGRSGLKLDVIEASIQRPSNVAVYFTVDTTDGDPVPGLTADQFKIYEDDKPVSILESKQTILNPEVSASHYTLLLVDMSGSVSESGDVPVIVEASKAFSDRIQKYQKVGVYAFDGSAAIHPIAPFTSGADAGGGVDKLASFKAKDPSTNLNGAVIEAIKVLERQMASSSTPLTFGTLVVFTDGTDRAQRVQRDKLHQALDNADLDLIAIGVGAEIDASELGSIGRNGTIVTKDRKQIASSFEKAAARVEGFSKRYYLLGYCSPARAGKHVVRIETTAAKRTGSAEYQFDAAGFGPNCDPNRPPAFNLRRPKKSAPSP